MKADTQRLLNDTLAFMEEGFVDLKNVSMYNDDLHLDEIHDLHMRFEKLKKKFKNEE